MLLVKIDEYIGFCLHRRSYLLGSPVNKVVLRGILYYGGYRRTCSDCGFEASSCTEIQKGNVEKTKLTV